MSEFDPATSRSDASDWANVGTPALRSLFAEGVAAEIAERTYPGQARWSGGQSRGADVAAGNHRYDAKSVRISGDSVVLARRNAEPYDAAKVDFLVLVHLVEATSGFNIDLASGLTKVQGAARVQDVWMLTVKEINALLPIHDDDDPVWRNVLLAVSDLEPFRLSFQ